VGALRDISQEKRVADELISSVREKALLEKNFAEARRAAKIGVFDYKIEQDLQFWSDELFEMTGLGRERFPAAAEEFIERIDEADRPLFDRLFQEAIEHGKGYQIIVRFHRPDGKVLRMRIHADVLESDDGRHIVGIARDVTDEIEASELLMRQEERFRIITQVLSDVVWDYDFKKGELWVTPDWMERLGITLGGEAFNANSWTNAILAPDRKRVAQSYLDAIKSSASEWVCEYRVSAPDKTHRYLESKARILRDANGRAYRLLGSLRDLTLEKEQEKRVARARTLEAIGKLTGGFAHDFNNLLMIVLGNAELLQLSDLEEDEAMSVKLIDKAARSGAELTKRLLSFSGQTSLQKVRVDLERTIGDLAVLLKSGLTEHIALTAQVAPDIASLEVDSEALEQAIINLVINARDALPRGGEIAITCRNVTISDKMAGDPDGPVPGDYVCINVTDNGQGMSEEVISKAFDPFFTTKEMGKGTGLGLSSVYGFARQSGGDVKITSELGSGTSIDLYLPVSASGAPEESVAPATAAPRALDDTVRKRILIVEDQPEVRHHVEGLLQRAGHEIVSAKDAHEALKVLEKDNAFDLLFTDVIMPGSLNGVQLSVRAGQLAPDMKVLFTSGFPAEAFDEIGIEHPDDVRMLKKPYRASELLDAIADAT
jgi:PAS domain S-box-containing protein